MKIKPKLDRRSNDDYQQIDDREWNALCRTAGLSRKQQILVGAYCDKQIKRKINETENAIRFGAFIHLRDRYAFGKMRLIRFDRAVTEIVNDAYSKECVDANGKLQNWDGCGLEHLEQKLHSMGINIGKGDAKE